MTGRLRDLLVVAKIPDGVRVLGPAHDNESEVYFDSGVEVIGRVERCHLSSNRGKQAELWVEEEQEPPFDLARSFSLDAKIVTIYEEGAALPRLSSLERAP